MSVATSTYRQPQHALDPFLGIDLARSASPETIQ